MGNNLCGHARAASCHGTGTKCSSGAKAAKGVRDPIEVALSQARVELDAGSLRSFNNDYSTGKIIGHGAFCKVQVCTHLRSGQEFAVKTVQKAPDNLKQREGIVKEIAIMRMLAGHPSVVQLQAVYEDEMAFHLVMELCRGGELFDQIVSRGHFSEHDAAVIMRALLDFVAFAHSKHIVHRDLKPENILLTSRDSSAQLKVIDFGTSEFCKPGQRLSQKFGTPYYVAPEVLQKNYAHAADVWSVGVIMFILLSGYPPFAGNCDARILQRIQRGSYSFAAKEWEVVTESAKAMISDMLVMDETKRSTAAALLQHSWLKMDATARRSSIRDPAAAAALGVHMVRRLRGFAKLSHMKRLALVVMTRTLGDHDVTKLRALFMQMDKDDDGCISSSDLHQALGQIGATIDEVEMNELFSVSGVSGQGGSIDYEEFIAAMLDSQRVAERLDAVRCSFDKLDRDGDGVISVEDLVRVLEERPAMKGPAGRKRSMELALQLVQEVDLDKDGNVSYEEYRKMWLQTECVV